MIDDFYRAYFVPTYKERQAEAFNNLRNRVAAYSGDGRESIKYHLGGKIMDSYNERIAAFLREYVEIPGGGLLPGETAYIKDGIDLLISEGVMTKDEIKREALCGYNVIISDDLF